MARGIIGFLICAMSVGVAGCEVARDAQLYPTDGNPGSSIIHGRVVGHGTGSGSVSFVMPNGETMTGRYTILFGGSAGFGSVFASVYGPHGNAIGTGTASNFSINGTGNGVAEVAGDRGTSMHCEFVNNNLAGHGYGACRSNTGSLYRLIY